MLSAIIVGKRVGKPAMAPIGFFKRLSTDLTLGDLYKLSLENIGTKI